MAWAGKILRVDLTNGSCASEPLNMVWADQYLGQRGLASKYLSEEMDPAVDALDPANVRIFATGPLTGTMAPTAGRYSVVTKGALTGAIACSNSGGKVGAEIKIAGWDMVIIKGKSPKPVYLHIHDEEVELRDAEHLWGRSVWDIEPAIKGRTRRPGGQGRLNWPGRRNWRAFRLHRQRPAPRRRTIRRRRGHGFEKPQGGLRTRHPVVSPRSIPRRSWRRFRMQRRRCSRTPHANV